MTGLFEELATLDALGLLSAEESASYRRLLLRDEEALASDRDHREAAARLAESLEPVPPPASVKAGIMAAVRRTPQQPAAVTTRTVRANEGKWYAQPAPGIDVKPLSVDKERGLVTILMKFAPGAVYPPHEHRGDEQSYVVSGSCRIGETYLREGDFHLAAADSHHDSVISDEGCVLLLLIDADDYVAA